MAASGVMDPQRRRLTVGVGGGSLGLPGGGGGASGGTEAHEATIQAVLDGAHRDGKKAVWLSSRTDSNKEKKPSFGEKEQDLRVGEGADKGLMETWLRTDLKIGVCCKKGLKPEAPNQDSFSILAVEGEYVLFGVYDGHGPNGHDVSDYVRLVLPGLLIGKGSELLENTGPTFTECFLACQALVEGKRDMDSSRSGTTCTMAFWNFAKSTVTIAHVADSRCVVGRGEAAEYETEDHKPNLPHEKKRIESASPPGRVVFDGFYNYRVFAQNGMYPGLNMSRALGDVVAHKEAGLTAEPDIKVLEVTPAGGVMRLMLCSDGVWEFLESKDGLDRILKATTLQKGVETLAKDSYDKWLGDSDGEISDDITAMVAVLAA